jgi:DNA-3-methyladenine glycosylase II
MNEVFHKDNYQSLCIDLAKRDEHLNYIVNNHGFPPMWTRKPNFQTLIHIILEQQVSLASARSALNKLKERLGTITPKKVYALTDQELRSCYFSRQKTIYAKCLAEAIITKQLNLKKLGLFDNSEIRHQLKKIKGIGDWTVDVFLLFALQRADIFPVGDLAMVTAMKEIKRLPSKTTHEQLLKLSEKWKPYRSVATMLLWHYYIQKRGIKI